MPLTPYDLMFTPWDQGEMRILEEHINTFLQRTFKQPVKNWRSHIGETPVSARNWTGKTFKPTVKLNAWEKKELREEVFRRFREAGWSCVSGIDEVSFKPAFMNQL